MYKHIIWDFDGTLFDAYPVMVKAMVHALRDNNIIETEEKVFELMKVSYPHLLKYLNEKYNINDNFMEQLKVVRKQYEDEYLMPFDGAKEICLKISNNNKYNHLFTHRDKSAVKYLKKYNMYDLFSGIVIMESGFERKPSPAGIVYLLDEYNINKEEAIIIGDRGLDLESGKNAGIDTCYYNIIDDNTLKSADYMVKSCEELHTIIFGTDK